MTDRNATAILVAGMHRSGTSALAGVLGKLGVPLGERLLEPGSDNPKGYWEHKDVVAIHDRLLTALGSRWDDVRAFPPDWLASKPARHAVGAIADIVARDFAEKPLWAVKDPRLCRFLPLWFEVLEKLNIRPVVVFVAREPGEVSASIEFRNHWRAPIGEMLWLRYMTEAEFASRGLPVTVVVFDDLLADPLATVNRALAAAGVAVGAQPSAQERDVVAGFIDTADRHHTHAAMPAARSPFALIADRAYDALASVARGANGWPEFRKVAIEFEDEWRNNGAAVDALAGMAIKLAAESELNWIEAKQLSSKLTAQIQWSEQAKAKHEALQAENAELSSKLTAQIRWSEQAQATHEVLQAANAELSSKLAAQIRWSEEAQADREALRATCDVLLRDKQNCDHLANSLAATLQSVEGSLSWRLTRPLRVIARALRRTRNAP